MAGQKKRLLVCGGRDFADGNALAGWMKDATRALGAASPDEVLVIHGGARGADSLAGAVAARSGVECLVFPADWEKHGRAAGFKRNQQMLVEGRPDLVLAAPGGRGTNMMVRIASEAGVAVMDMRS
jgi:hypothetical protein